MPRLQRGERRSGRRRRRRLGRRRPGCTQRTACLQHMAQTGPKALRCALQRTAMAMCCAVLCLQHTAMAMRCAVLVLQHTAMAMRCAVGSRPKARPQPVFRSLSIQIGSKPHLGGAQEQWLAGTHLISLIWRLSYPVYLMFGGFCLCAALRCAPAHSHGHVLCCAVRCSTQPWPCAVLCCAYSAQPRLCAGAEALSVSVALPDADVRCVHPGGRAGPPRIRQGKVR